MEIVVVLMVFSLIIALFFLGAFIWAHKTGQFEDTYTPSVRMLFDSKKSSSSKNTQKL